MLHQPERYEPLTGECVAAFAANCLDARTRYPVLG